MGDSPDYQSFGGSAVRVCPVRQSRVIEPARLGLFCGTIWRCRRQRCCLVPNLNGDAVLVGPCPVGPVKAYAHLAAFVREAPDAQKHALWKLVGELMERRLELTPDWLSTAGAGVPWLHVRLDRRPKYYSHAPYRGQ